jgi:hypothetical protein
MRSGDRPGLQNRRSLSRDSDGGFDSHSLPPKLSLSNQQLALRCYSVVLTRKDALWRSWPGKLKLSGGYHAPTLLGPRMTTSPSSFARGTLESALMRGNGCSGGPKFSPRCFAILRYILCKNLHTPLSPRPVLK